MKAPISYSRSAKQLEQLHVQAKVLLGVVKLKHPFRQICRSFRKGIFIIIIYNYYDQLQQVGRQSYNWKNEALENGDLVQESISHEWKDEERVERKVASNKEQSVLRKRKKI